MRSWFIVILGALLPSEISTKRAYGNLLVHRLVNITQISLRSDGVCV